jgi:hypothetical protein
MELPANEQGGYRPVPDPTVLTTEALQREILALRQLLELRVVALRDLLEQRTDAVSRLTSSELEVQAVRCEQQFQKVGQQLQSAEQQRVEQKQDTKAAVDAALTAQKEAVAEQTTASERSIAKSEAATTKSIEQLGTTFNTAFEGIRRDIDGLKERIGAAEQQKVGSKEASTGIYGLAGFVLALLTAGAIVAAFVK